jgi:hypothetical protein
MVFNATFNNISAISWRSVLLVGETGGLGENDVDGRLDIVKREDGILILVKMDSCVNS